jgi:autoinducer 2-degrading protein
MHVTIVHVFVEPDQVEAFIGATRLNHEGSVEEPGNRRFDVLQDASQPTKFVLYEAYASEADAKAHKETEHYRRWRETVAPMMAEPRQGVVHRGLFPRG